MARTLMLLLTLAIGRVASADGLQSDVIGRIEREWRARQDRCTSGIFRWKQDEFYEKGAYGSNERVDSIVLDYEFAFKEDGFCNYSLDGLRWNMGSKQFDHETMRQARSRTEVRSLFAGGRHGRFPAGWIHRRETLEEGENFNYEAPLFTFRPLAPGISWFKLAEWTVVAESEEIDGRSCVHLAKQLEHLWLDSQRGYLPVRHEWRLEGGELSMRLDTDYVPHAVAGWAPHTWRYVRIGNSDEMNQGRQKVTEGFTSTVTEFQLNVAIPDSTFEIVFPPGTRYMNEKTEQGGIVREDGSFRLIDRSELATGKSWDELMHTDAPSVVNSRWAIGIWSSIAIAIVGTVTIVIYRRRRSV